MSRILNGIWNLIEKIVRWCLTLVFRILKKDVNESVVEGFLQFVKFGIIGLSNTVISYILNVAVLLILSPFSVSWDFFAGNMVGFLLSVLWSFYWNNRFVFTMQEGQRRSVWKALLKTYLAYGFTGIILNNILSWLWITKFGISKFIAPVINLIVSVPLNFIINKLWAFRAE